MNIENNVVDGRIKWFDAVKGYGFIVSDEGHADILLHANVLRNYGQSSVADGAEISIRVTETDRGLQAIEILSLELTGTASGAELADFVEMDPDELAALEVVPARIKWFDKAKGFGFANAFGAPEDVFVHIEVLRLSGLADLMPGEAVALRTIEGKRGLMAAEVLAWDKAMDLDL